MRCACRTLTYLDGVAAKDYAKEHLRKMDVDWSDWSVQYACDETGARWVMEFPLAHLHGSGPARLRQLDDAGQVIEDPGTDPFT